MAVLGLTAQQEVIFSILAYSLCSGSLVLVNKLTLHYLPFPSLVVTVQLIACIIMIYTANSLGKLTIDPIKWEFVKPYLYYTVLFSSGVYCNMRSLNISNVETVIVFRALSPALVAFMDALCLGREWPSSRSWVGLSLLVVGAYGYASYDEKFQAQGASAYSWPSLYTVIIAVEMAYGKKIIQSVKLETMSGPVIYTNLLGILPMMALATVGNEYSQLRTFWWASSEHHIPPASIPLLIAGCLVGTGIGYSGWWCRGVVSATSFTLIGVMNKCLTILINLLIWDQHAKPGGIASLFLCIAGGIIYQQAPMKGAKTDPVVMADDEAFKTDVSEEAHKSEEEIDLIEKQTTGTKRRG
jgi:drug/metabolite transporter (DMT)-like permease